MSVQVKWDDQGIATLWMDTPDRSTNVLNRGFIDSLRLAFDAARSRSDLRGIILASAKPVFVAGADIDMLANLNVPAEIMELASGLKRLFREMETCGKPVVAAIGGAALGGGFELALACHARIVLNSEAVKLGLPEVKLGLLPGGGGTQRLSRLIGIQNALPLMLEGREVGPRDALDLGMIQQIVDEEEALLPAARQWILDHPDACQPWDEKGFKWPGGDSNHPKNAQMWAIAPSMLRKKTFGNYPAAELILASVYEGSRVDFDTGSVIESRYFAKCACSSEARNMIHTFWYQLNQIKRGESRPDGVPVRPVKKLGMLGAGMMGAGIALVCARAGIQVVLKDVTGEAAEQGKAYARRFFEKRVTRGKMKDTECRAILERIQPTVDAKDLNGCDLVIEAVFEDRDLKARVTAEAEAQLSAEAVFASNTSTLPITSLARASSRPAQFIGLHFFSPVEKMPLVEIIVGQQTSQETLAFGFDFVQQIKKTPIVVNDSRGFYTSRVFSSFVLEGIALLAEGSPATLIEWAGRKAGMPVGPLAVSDEVSLSLMCHIQQQTAKDLQAAGKSVEVHPAHEVVRSMVEVHDRPGRKSGRGFYDYPEGEKKRLWKELHSHFPVCDRPLNVETMMSRMMVIQALETVRCMDEGVLTHTADANVGSIFGWGFAPFKGGTLQYINDMGVPEFVETCKQLEKRFGSRFRPTRSLESMAARGESF